MQKDEIKEILDKYKMYMSFDGNEYEMIQKAELHKLLDYITNLQEERDFYKCTDSMNMESNIELRGRIDKAIEYITTEQLYTNYQWGKSQYAKILKDLLNILQGENKE